MNQSEEIISNDITINILNGDLYPFEDTEYWYSLSSYGLRIFKKKGKKYLVLNGLAGAINPWCSISLLKQIITQLQKTVKNITDEDLIDLQKERKNDKEIE